MNAAAATDTGFHRERNEDRHWVDKDRGVFLVVDGVGGHAGGETAAQTAVEEIRASLACTFGNSDRRVRVAITAANNRIFKLAQHYRELRGMSCVLTLALVEGDHVTIGHVGDSRLYLIWSGTIKKLTPDHSHVGAMEDAGEITEAEAMRHPRRNEIFRDVGSQYREPDDADFIEIRHCRFLPEAAFLLCSDGLTDQLTSALVLEIVERYLGNAAQVAWDLVEAANLEGGNDNVTALFVAGPEYEGRRRGGSPCVRTHLWRTR